MHYEDVWENDHRRKLETQLNAAASRKQLLNMLDSTQMLQIMFKGYLDKLHDNKVIELSKEYLKEQNIKEHKNSEVKIIETHIILDSVGRLRDHQSRVIMTGSWEEYIKAFCEYDGTPVCFPSTTSLTGNSVNRNRRIYNLKFDNWHMSCDVLGECLDEKHFGYLVQ